MEPAVIAVDWGTSSFRLWALAPNGDVMAERKGAFGMAKLGRDDFYPTLIAGLTALGVDPDIPVIICSGYNAMISEKESVQMGIDAYLKKPFQMAELASTVRTVLDGQREN